MRPSARPDGALVAALVSGSAALTAALLWRSTFLAFFCGTVTVLSAFAWYMRRAGALGDDERPSEADLVVSRFGTLIDRRSAVRMLGLSALLYGPFRAMPVVLEKVTGGRSPALQQPVAARIRQWAMIIDLRYCDGCQSVGTPPQCTLACIEGHLAPEPMQWIEVFEEELEGEGTRFLPTPCQHCQNPPCVNVCPVAATFSTPEGLVLIDQDRCIGCRICMAACPYDRRFFNWGEPPVPPEAHLAHYDLEVQAPARKGTVMKCDFCPDMVRAGTLPYCIQACPNNAIYYGDLEEDVASNGTDVVSINRFLAENDASLLKQELGTQPRVFYVPGHGEAVGRDPSREGRLPTTWPWTEHAEGSTTWNR